LAVTASLIEIIGWFKLAAPAFIALSSKVASGSREENASKQ
jgi:hypothetical protein